MAPVTEETLTAPQLDAVVGETLAMAAVVAHGGAAPSVGRIVHVDHTVNGCSAAVVTKVADGEMWVTVFLPDALPVVVAFPVVGTAAWHWPERNAG